jgi:2-oxoglutarate dehydrogenase E2 component (dihydrolipoamide succinyltransferase)
MVFGKPPQPAQGPVHTRPRVEPAPASEADAAGERLVELSTMRRAIAEHMSLSKRTAPHVTTLMEADMSRAAAHRAANRAAFAREGVDLTYTPYFTAAAAAALRAFPLVNSSWSSEGIRVHPAVNIGIAVSLGEEGLIVPVIQHADSYSLLGLARSIHDLADRARRGKLKPDEVQGGTFSITNHGTGGSLLATPVIHQPQCAILGVGMIQKRVVVVSEGGYDAIAIRPMVYLTLTFDHRILDGASADGFLKKVVEELERWDDK